MAPLCKGGCHDLGRDWGIVAVHRTAGELAIFVTIPPSQLTLCHLPLHKGGFGISLVCADNYRFLTPHPCEISAHPVILSAAKTLFLILTFRVWRERLILSSKLKSSSLS